ncbi:Discs, large -associated protein [Chamberlinius hualienensis]
MDRYKKKPLNFCEGVEKRQLRLHRKSLHQKEARNKEINLRRGLIIDDENEHLSPQKSAATTVRGVISRREQLAKWREEKLLRKKLDAEKKKPAFKFCKIKYDTPVFLHSNKEQSKSQNVGVVTRSMAKAATNEPTKIPKRIVNAKVDKSVAKPVTENKTVGKAVQETKGAKEVTTKPKAVTKTTGTSSRRVKNAAKSPASKIEAISKLPVPTNKGPSPRRSSEVVENGSSINTSENSAPIIPVEDEPTAVSRKSFAPEFFQFKAPANLPVYVYGKPESPSDDEVKDAQPEITSNAKEESNKDNNDANNSSDTKTVDHFRILVKDNTAFLSEKSAKWSALNEEYSDELPENVKGRILTVVGQTTLLLTKKFKQFSGLIDECEQKGGPYQTNVDDLQGFWDMVYFQVEDLVTKYNKLDQIMNDNWVETISPVKKMTRRTARPVTKVRVNKTQEARQRLAKAKTAVVVAEDIFSPLPAKSNSENECISHIKPTIDSNVDAAQPLVRIHDRMSFLQQISTRENIGVVDKTNLAQLFSPIKTEGDSSFPRKSTMNDQLIRFSDIHCFTDKENVRKTNLDDIFSPVIPSVKKSVLGEANSVL